MEPFDPLSRPFWNMFGMALLCGTIVGIERQARGKPAGVRTSILICVGTSIFVHLGRVTAGEFGDPVRVLGQLVTGVGFLGAGVIMARESTVTGVTTAAVIWVLAAIGSTIGLGHYPGALALALLTVAVLTGVEFLESSLRWLARGIYEKD